MGWGPHSTGHKDRFDPVSVWVGCCAFCVTGSVRALVTIHPVDGTMMHIIDRAITVQFLCPDCKKLFGMCQ